MSKKYQRLRRNKTEGPAVITKSPGFLYIEEIVSHFLPAPNRKSNRKSRDDTSDPISVAGSRPIRFSYTPSFYFGRTKPNFSFLIFHHGRRYGQAGLR